jgi:hypothetical protein
MKSKKLDITVALDLCAVTMFSVWLALTRKTDISRSRGSSRRRFVPSAGV